MNPKSAESLVFGYRVGRPNDSSTEKAVKTIERDPEQKRRLDEQVAFDQQIARAVRAIVPPQELRQKLAPAKRPALKGTPYARTIWAAIVCGVLILIGLVVLIAIERKEKFPGRDAVERMVGVAKKTKLAELSEVNSKAGDLGDWFAMNRFDSFNLPPELVSRPAVGARMFMQEGFPVAQVVLHRDELTMLQTFRPTDFGVELPASPEWRILHNDDWVGAARTHGELCTVIAFRGDTAAMESYLQSLSKP